MNTTKTLQTLKMKWTGFRPLIMSNPQTVQLSNRYAVESRRLNSEMKNARRKGDEDRLCELENEQRANDFCASAYWHEGDFFLPDTVIIACLRESGRAMKKGKDIDRAVMINEHSAVIATPRRFKSLEEAFDDPSYRLECPAKVPPKTGALIWKCRCMIPTGWSVDVSFDYDPEMIAQKTLQEIAVTAGKLVGLGGWRPKFGRFDVEVIA